MQLKSLKDTQNFSKNISKIISVGDIIFLYGEIGVGKTTFVRFFINYLESKNGIKNSDVLSPTFNIVYDYDVGNIKILHYDLYRLKNYKDISQLGMFETSSDHIKIIEWPDLIKPKPKNRVEALRILKKLNGKKHYLISSVCISQNGIMIWNYMDKASLTMFEMTEKNLVTYLNKITDEALYAYNVYQIEGEGRSLFSIIEGDKNTIMGLPINKIKEYLNSYK